MPLDGDVLDGRSAVDESMVTDDAMPVTKQAGDTGLQLLSRARERQRAPPGTLDISDGSR
jgi:hypothetical protein